MESTLTPIPPMKTLVKPIRLEPRLPAVKTKKSNAQPRYTILETLGEGGLGVVNRAHDTKLDREVAIKRLRQGQTNMPVSPSSLSREALMLASLNHPNIVSVYDVYEENDEVCIVMELLDGVTLDRVLDASKMGMEEFNELVQQTQEALLAAYSKDIIHGDIKPQNIIKVEKVYGQDQYKLLDFDQARLVGSKAPLESSHSTCGSIFFMAPERFEGTEPNHGSDTYAMGSIYYYALTGQFPCQGSTSVEIMAAHLRSDIIPLNKLRPDLPEWLCQWIHWLMARNPADRPQSPRAVKESYTELIKRFSSLPDRFIDVPEERNETTIDNSKIEEPRWHVARDNKVGGPHTWETIQKFIKADLLKTTDLIKNDSMSKWSKIGDLLAERLQSVG
ncbi:MAG: protein kinase [Akkermansiaceae bacterium]